MIDILRLKDSEPLASGSMRLVFRHPHHPELLVKVIRPEMTGTKQGGLSSWFRSRRRFREYVTFVREFEEYIASYARYGKSASFMQAVVGMVETDYGLGIVLKAASDPEGNLAPTLWTLINTGRFDRTAGAALETFCSLLLESNVVVADLHPGNLVYSQDADGAAYFQMIDGFGSSNFIPFKVIFPALNLRSKVRRIKLLRGKVAANLAALDAAGAILPYSGDWS